MNKLMIVATSIAVTLSLLVACSGGSATTEGTSTAATSSTSVDTSLSQGTTTYDPNRGEGKFDEANVKLGKLDVAMADKGKATAQTKCFSCHKTTTEKLVGPGWKGITAKKPAHWIMNFITNPDPMIDKDPEVQAQLEICLVRMPNQNLSDDEAREIVEFMRQNDGAK